MFDTLPEQTSTIPAAKSAEGWVLFVTGILEEHNENDILDLFSDFGEVKQLRIPLNRNSGFPYGFALVQYADLLSAKEAINQLDGAECLGTVLQVTWAFQKQ